MGKHHKGIPLTACSLDKNVCAREKLWTELTDLEKIERLGAIVSRLGWRLDAANHDLNNLVAHEHSGKDLMVPMNHDGTRPRANNILDHS